MKTKIFLSLIFLIFCKLSFSQSDTIITSTGLKYLILKKGTGILVEAGKEVEVHYTGYLVTGKKFDSSIDRGEKFDFVVGKKQVISGWDEGLLLMKVGDKFRFIIPPELAYGEKGAGDIIPPNSTLIFDIELFDVRQPKIPIADTIYTTIISKGIKPAVKLYKSLKSSFFDKYNFKEDQLNILGYILLGEKKIKEAIEILKLNVESFPGSSNVYDSLGEAYMADSDNELAIKNYKKSLKLNPDNENAKKMLQELQKDQ
jgi:tetratricopeptide (TPR) repeat protein